MEVDPSREHLRESVITKADELLAGIEYREDTPGYTERRELKNMFGTRLLRRASLNNENNDEEIVIDERSVRLFGKTNRTRLSVYSMRSPGGDGRGGYQFDWSYKILHDPEVAEHADLLQSVLSLGMDEREHASRQLRVIGHGGIRNSF